MKRISVAILLSPTTDPERVLLVERNPRLKFMGGYLAFPGGTLEGQDEAVPVENLALNGASSEKDLPRFLAAAARELFDLPEDRFIFLFVFDFLSYVERKNPLGLVRAFRRAFADTDRALLVLKATNSDRDPPAARSTRRMVVTNKRNSLSIAHAG